MAMHQFHYRDGEVQTRLLEVMKKNKNRLKNKVKKTVRRNKRTLENLQPEDIKHTVLNFSGRWSFFEKIKDSKIKEDNASRMSSQKGTDLVEFGMRMNHLF